MADESKVGVENMDIETGKGAAPEQAGSSMMTMILGVVAVVSVIAAVVVVIVVVGGKSDDAATSSGVTNYFVQSSVTLAGVTASQFNTAARREFSKTIATKMGVQPNNVHILTAARRSLAVTFKVYKTSPIPASVRTTLTSFLSDTGANGFKTKLNANFAAASGVSITVTGVSGIVVTKQKGIVTKMPTMVLMPTPKNTTGGSRRSVPANSPLAQFSPDVETYVPGGIADSIKTPKEILCYVGQSQVMDRGAWGGATAYSSSMPSIISKYDPAECTGKKKNQTSEYMLFQAWHTGNPSAASGTWNIKGYFWVYTTDPRLSTSNHFVTAEVTFTIRNSAAAPPSSSPKTELQTIQILFSMVASTETEVHGGTTISHGMTSGCGKIDATLANGNEFTDIKSYMDQSLTMTMSESGKSMSLTAGQVDAAVMKLESDKVTGKAQTTRENTCTAGTCTGFTNTECSNQCSQMGSKQAAVVAFNDAKAGIQTATTTAQLGISASTPNLTPQTCLNRAGTAARYPRGYKIFDATTGYPKDFPNPNGYVNLYVYNTSGSDANGNPWAGWNTPQPLHWPVYNAAGQYVLPQPVSVVGCVPGHCWADPGGEKDFDADGITDGWFAQNTIPDGLTINTNQGMPSWENSAGITGSVVVKQDDVAEVLPSVATSQCSVVTLGALSPAPDTLHCGNTATGQKSTPTNGNNGQAPPSPIPSTITYINNERVVA